MSKPESIMILDSKFMDWLGDQILNTTLAGNYDDDVRGEVLAEVRANYLLVMTVMGRFAITTEELRKYADEQSKDIAGNSASTALN